MNLSNSPFHQHRQATQKDSENTRLHTEAQRLTAAFDTHRLTDTRFTDTVPKLNEALRIKSDELAAAMDHLVDLGALIAESKEEYGLVVAAPVQGGYDDAEEQELLRAIETARIGVEACEQAYSSREEQLQTLVIRHNSRTAVVSGIRWHEATAIC